MKISNYLKREFCAIDIKASTKEDAIREIVRGMAAAGEVEDAEKFIKSVLRREHMGSTGIGYGVAIPHARTESVRGFVIGFGRSKEGIGFSAIDGEKARLIFVMGANPRELNLYLRLLAELAKLLTNNSFRKELLEAATCEDVIAIVRKHEA